MRQTIAGSRAERMRVYLNGAWLDAADAALGIDDRGFLYGDGVFETVRVHRGGYFRLDAHLARLRRGAQALQLPLPEAGELRFIAAGILAKNDVAEGTLRITLTRGPEGGGDPTLLVTLRPITADWMAVAQRGWSVITARTRHPAADALPPHVKSIGRLHGLLARLEAAGAGADDALLLSSDGLVTEGPTWNVFWRVGTILRTPALDAGVLDGVTRATILDLAPVVGLAVEEGKWPREALDEAEEVFATMSSMGCVSFTRLDGRDLDQAAATAARRLFSAYWDRVGKEAARPRGE